jgi:hypothetical protein
MFTTVLLIILAAVAAVAAVLHHQGATPCECMSPADVEVLELPEGTVVKVTLDSKVIVEGRVSVRHLPGFLAPTGWVGPVVQVVVKAETVPLAVP